MFTAISSHCSPFPAISAIFSAISSLFLPLKPYSAISSHVVPVPAVQDMSSNFSHCSPFPAISSKLQPPLVISSLFQLFPAYSNLLEPIIANYSLLQHIYKHIPANSTLFQYIPAYTSLFKPIKPIPRKSNLF